MGYWRGKKYFTMMFAFKDALQLIRFLIIEHFLEHQFYVSFDNFLNQFYQSFIGILMKNSLDSCAMLKVKSKLNVNFFDVAQIVIIDTIFYMLIGWEESTPYRFDT